VYSQLLNQSASGYLYSDTLFSSSNSKYALFRSTNLYLSVDFARGQGLSVRGESRMKKPNKVFWISGLEGQVR